MSKSCRLLYFSRRLLTTGSLDYLEGLVKFSFKYLAETERFNFVDNNSDYFIELLSKLEAISQMSIKEFKSGRDRSLRCHKIDWVETSEINGFRIPNEEVVAAEPYQFAISANEYGRIHGFIIENRFYVVWIDKDHLLYPSK